ncbi:MAG: ATP-binding protein, partial [Pirellulaceae bacterium]
SLNRSAVAAYGCICIALVLLLGTSVWNTYCEVRSFRSTLLQAEVTRVRARAERTVGRLERELESQDELDLSLLARNNWLRDYWLRVIPQEEQRLYAAIVDRQGRVVLHNSPDRVGGQLARQWYDRLAPEAGEWVVETRSAALTAGQRALDVRVPIVYGDREVGEYHTGFDLNWFDEFSAAQRSGFLRQRLLLLGSVVSIVLLAAMSLYYIATHSVFLRRAVSTAHLERTAEIGQLAAGLAHEIRNPLHAIRLNLHTFQRSQQSDSSLEPEEMKTMLEQSSREIERIDRLMQELVGFAMPEAPRDELIDLKAELQGILDFIDQEMVRNQVEVRAELPPRSVLVRFDPGRLRQIMINLLHNAAAASESNGRVMVALAARGGQAEITVADHGSGVSDADRERIFEPFYTTKSDGTGLGLALVKRFVDEADGEIHCEHNPGGGTIFRIRVPEQPKP